MKKIPLSEVKPGMVLARPLINRAGLILYKQGTPLDTIDVERLKRFGVLELFIEENPEVAELSLEAQKKTLSRRFRRLTDSGVVRDMRRVLETRLEKKASADSSEEDSF